LIVGRIKCLRGYLPIRHLVTIAAFQNALGSVVQWIERSPPKKYWVIGSETIDEMHSNSGKSALVIKLLVNEHGNPEPSQR